MNDSPAAARPTNPPTAEDPAPPRTLPGGLVLRTAGPADLEQIGELLARRGDAVDALDHRLVVEDPEAGWASCAVVVDGDRVVSTATLLDEVVRIGDVHLPAGQVELVATDRAYEGRGLVRALMEWAHERSAARGHVVQVMIGIPYFYRLFGYEYAIDIPPARTVRTPPPGAVHGGPVLRAALPADVPALADLQAAAQGGFDVAIGHPAARWRWLLGHEASSLWVVERDGAVVASGRITPPDAGGVLVAEASAVDAAAAHALLRGVAARRPGAEISVVPRAGTGPADAGQEWVDATPQGRAEQYYVRIPDPAALLDRLRPLLERRLAAAGIDRPDRAVVISTFGAHYRLPVTADGLGPVVTGGTMQSPGAVRGAAVAPDQLPALLFGPHGLAGLTKLRPDVYAGDRTLFDALFPPRRADVLSYYLPY
ncbi:GNAT family N-acetyltransferase [Streptomyces sp. HSW2009]|uniref:GNAT family N-acetyltransferase n=1 Tax=Streptomyces sp. HSW2009 TaxID=3142890 RepID=UPI0032EBAED6